VAPPPAPEDMGEEEDDSTIEQGENEAARTDSVDSE
jgi:hypothetical protein